jgi:hypothetical protein
MARKANGNGKARNVFGPRYRAYIYKGERDPAMDDIYSLARNEGVTDEQLHVMSGVSTSTFKNWWGPKATTRRPTHVCLAATAGALGYEYELVRRRTITVEEEVRKGEAWLEKQKAAREKK